MNIAQPQAQAKEEVVTSLASQCEKPNHCDGGKLDGNGCASRICISFIRRDGFYKLIKHSHISDNLFRYVSWLRTIQL